MRGRGEQVNGLQRFAAVLRRLFGPAPVGKAEIRAEVWRLGVRHFGRPLEGAREELKARDLPAHRVQLLRACVVQLEAR
jgi:hypothetical protein